jgi:hypothetical protein
MLGIQLLDGVGAGVYDALLETAGVGPARRQPNQTRSAGARSPLRRLGRLSHWLANTGTAYTLACPIAIGRPGAADKLLADGSRRSPEAIDER